MAMQGDMTAPPPVTTVPPQRGQKRGRVAEEDGDEAAARCSSRRVRAGAGGPDEIETAWWFSPEEEVEAVPWWWGSPVDAPSMAEVMVAALSRPAAGPYVAPALYEDGGVRALCRWDFPSLYPLPPPSCSYYDFAFAHATAADPSHGPASPEEHAILDGFSATAGGDSTSAGLAAGGAPDPSSSGPLGFDLNQLLSSNVPDEEEGFLEVPENAIVDGSAAATADGGGSVELVADGATARSSSRRFDFDLNQPCPSELVPDVDPSGVPDPAPAAPVEDSLAAPEADEPPKLPDGGAPVPPTRRRRSLASKLWDWAFGR